MPPHRRALLRQNLLLQTFPSVSNIYFQQSSGEDDIDNSEKEASADGMFHFKKIFFGGFTDTKGNKCFS